MQLSNKSNIQIATLIALTIAINCFSYPTTATLISLAGLPSTVVNFILKAIYASISSFLIWRIILKEKIAINVYVLSLFVFIQIYSIRLVYDLLIRDIQFVGGDKGYVFSYFFGATVLPVLAIALGSQYIDAKKNILYIYIACFIANISVLLYVATLGTTELLQMLTTRVQLKGDEEQSGVLLNPITISYYGASLAFQSLALLYFERIVKVKRIYLIISLLLGLSNLIMGASKGPLFSFFLVAALLVIYNLLVNFKLRNLFILISFVISVVVGGYIVISLTGVSLDEIQIVKRLAIFTETREAGQKEERDYLYEAAINDFINSPVVGDQFVNKQYNSYPHNIILEVLMATGIIGFLFFLIPFLRYFINLYIAFSHKFKSAEFILLGIGLLAIMLSMTSGSLFANPDVWIFITLGISLSSLVKYKNGNKLKNIDASESSNSN